MKTQAQKKLEIDFKIVVVCCILLFFFLIVALVASSIKQNNLRAENAALQVELNQCYKAEVIYGKLYVGYEDGIRIGYFQDHNKTWHRCARNCEILE